MDKEVENFLKILSILIERGVIEIEGYEDGEDGKLDIIVTITKKIGQLLEGDIDSLGLPSAVAKTLKTLKVLVDLIKNAKNNDTCKRKKVKPRSKIGTKRTRNRAIKIKKLLPQAKIVEVKKNGYVLRKMTVRRRTYFPGRRKVTY